MRTVLTLLILSNLLACGGDDSMPAGSDSIMNDNTVGDGSGGTSSTGGRIIAQGSGGSPAVDEDSGMPIVKPKSVSEAISQATGGKTPTECGCIGYDNSCPPDQVASITTCFNDGYQACEPVQLDWIQHSADGAPIVTSYVTQNSNGSCRVVVLADYTKDTSENCKLYRLLCQSINFSGLGKDTKVEGQMCTPAEILDEGC